MEELIEVINNKFTQEHTKVFREEDYNDYHVFREDGTTVGYVSFQHAPVKEADSIDGMFNEDLLLMVIDRLEHFQSTEQRCKENTAALYHLYRAVEALRERTERRRLDGTLGTSREEQYE